MEQGCGFNSHSLSGPEIPAPNQSKALLFILLHRVSFLVLSLSYLLFVVVNVVLKLSTIQNPIKPERVGIACSSYTERSFDQSNVHSTGDYGKH